MQYFRNIIANIAMTVKRHFKTNIVPLQYFPSPKYPELHSHLYEPGTFIHFACFAQLDLLKHSFISRKQKNILKCSTQ